MGQRSHLITVSNGLLEPKHFEAMGLSLWSYLLLLDWQTDRRGWVQDGTAVTSRSIGRRLGIGERQARRHLQQLKSGGYVSMHPTARGWLVEIQRPKKLFRRYLRADNYDPLPDNDVPLADNHDRTRPYTPRARVKHQKKIATEGQQPFLPLSPMKKPASKADCQRCGGSGIIVGFRQGFAAMDTYCDCELGRRLRSGACDVKKEPQSECSLCGGEGWRIEDIPKGGTTGAFLDTREAYCRCAAGEALFRKVVG